MYQAGSKQPRTRVHYPTVEPPPPILRRRRTSQGFEPRLSWTKPRTRGSAPQTTRDAKGGCGLVGLPQSLAHIVCWLLIPSFSLECSIEQLPTGKEQHCDGSATIIL